MASLTHFHSHSHSLFQCFCVFVLMCVRVCESVQCYNHLPISVSTARCAHEILFLDWRASEREKEKCIKSVSKYFISRQSSIQLTTGFACQNQVLFVCFFPSGLAIIGTFSIFNGYDGIAWYFAYFFFGCDKTTILTQFDGVTIKKTV